MSGNNRLYPPASARPDQSYPIRGSRAWTRRVLELFDRDRMEDFEELCILMGVPSVPRQGVEHPSGSNTSGHS